jgi:hypothetical protein
MATILNVPITTAVSLQVGTVYQLRSGPGASDVPSSLGVQSTVTGTLGTNMTWWIQFSYDDGASFCDALAGVQTGASRWVGASVSMPSAGLIPAVASDGGGTPPFVAAGVFSGLIRVKYSSTGTWTLGNLRIDTFGGYIEPATG